MRFSNALTIWTVAILALTACSRSPTKGAAAAPTSVPADDETKAKSETSPPRPTEDDGDVEGYLTDVSTAAVSCTSSAHGVTTYTLSCKLVFASTGAPVAGLAEGVAASFATPAIPSEVVRAIACEGQTDSISMSCEVELTTNYAEVSVKATLTKGEASASPEAKVILGDLDADGDVDYDDAQALFDQWAKTGDVTGDLNDDGIVDAADAGILFANWTTPPEPAP